MAVHVLDKTGITAAQEAFCREYVKNGNAAQSYKKAYPKSQKWQASALYPKAQKLLARGYIRARIDELRNSADNAAIITLQKGLETLTELALSAELSPRDRIAAIALAGKFKGWEAAIKTENKTENLVIFDLGIKMDSEEAEEDDNATDE